MFNDETGHDFTFTSTYDVAYAERGIFKQELTSIISYNRSSGQNENPMAASAAANFPAPNVALSTDIRPTGSRSELIPNDTRQPSLLPGNYSTTEIRLRKRVLMTHPELGALHRELVASGQISETEFWEGREVGVCEVSLKTKPLKKISNSI